MLSTLSSLSACGDKEGFIAVDEPEFSVDEPGHLRLRMPSGTMKNETQKNIRLRNSGDGTLRIVKMELVDTPDRILVLGTKGRDCDANLSCEGIMSIDDTPVPLENPVCLTATKTCRGTGFGKIPLEIGGQLSLDIILLIKKGSIELDCNPAPTDLPADIDPEDYCGKIHIETNALNTVGIVEKGVADIYILRPLESSGEIDIVENSLDFIEVIPGNTQKRSITVKNNGKRTLTINTIAVEKNEPWFVFKGRESNVPTTIEPGQIKVWDVELSVPANTTDFDFSTRLFIDSSAANNSSGEIAVSVTAGSGGAPNIEFETTPLKFDTMAEQTLTLNNTGQTTLQISGLTIKPASARPFYKFEVDGNDVTNITNNMTYITIQKGKSKDLVVKFLRPDLNTNNATATLEINHNDRFKNLQSSLILLGDHGDAAIGKINPDGFVFYSADGNTSTRTFAIRNLGTAPLVISAANLTADLMTEFKVTGAVGTIEPGELKKATITYTDEDVTPESGLLELESNHKGGAFELVLRSVAVATPVPVPVIKPLFKGNAKVGFSAKFTNEGSTPESVRKNGIWTLISRPASSKVWISTTGESISFKPDVAGQYEIGLLLNEKSREAQIIFPFTVE